jgi:hypothetical protein
MGRHSASSGDEDEAVLAAAADEPAAVLTGRHARVEEPPAAAPEADEEPLVSLDEVAADDGPLGLIAEQMVEPVEPAPDPVEPAPESVAPVEPSGRKVGRGNQSTAADLALLRERSDVRARVIAALLVPFVLYTAVLYLIGAFGLYLINVWIPLVSGGVLAGFILDAEHRKHAGPTKK